jgi:hypothetical protein
MPTGQIALVREQGVEFAVVCVLDSVVSSQSQREEAYRAWTFRLQRPVALMGAQRHEVFGHEKIVDFVSSIDPSRLPWRNFHS